MGKNRASRDTWESSRRRFTDDSGPATRKAEQRARETGKLHPLVDPAGYGLIRRSLPRMEQLPNGLWQMLVGCPMPVETRFDTTGSMGGMVDVIMRVLPHMIEGAAKVLPGQDLQVLNSIFGDMGDTFVLCRGQFEMTSDKLVEQLTLMVPERAGGDIPEDPHYGLFGAAYLTAAYIHRLGLKSYDFTVSDAPARYRLNSATITRIYGPTVYDVLKENGFEVNSRAVSYTKQVVQDLLTRAHAFFIQVGGPQRETTEFWTDVFGPERVVQLRHIEYLPQLQALIIGLTEGQLSLLDAADFLRQLDVPDSYTGELVRAVSHIPIGAQMLLPSYHKKPKAGDLFREKTDLFPLSAEELRALDLPSSTSSSDKDDPINWL